MTSSKQFRLPDDIVPLTHNLTLTPNLDSFEFIGEEDVFIKIVRPTCKIMLNAIEVAIHSASLTLTDGQILTPSEISLQEDSETVTITFKETILPGEGTLTLSFSGKLNDQLRGFYRSEYQNPDGEKRYIATTQFEATDARRAFPCWDEPNIKSRFHVSLIIPAELTAISNMPIENEEPLPNGLKAVRFSETPKMSTYLLAFIVGDLASVEARAANGTLVRVFATRGKEQQGLHALGNAVALLSYFNDYFGISYPLPKLDHIAIPDFAAGAMENWGAITYRETALLFDPEKSAANTRQRILEVVSHEMAHMWFGDLVTMKWWNDLWLNESFASWMGDKAVNELYPEWQMWTQFVSQDTNAALSLDGLRNSHPIEAEVKDPSEIRELFDAISYSKGGSILRMLEEFLGEEVFRAGLREYIAKNQYSNAETKDLWESLENASGQPVTRIMDTWTKQMGYPLLTVEIDRDQIQPSLKISQQRFLYDHILNPSTKEKNIWEVPVSVISENTDKETSFLLTENEAQVPLVKDTASGWIKFNGLQTGFYRVLYSSEEWERLSTAVRNLELPATDRLGLQNDAYALMRSGFAPATLFLSIADSYQGETDASVWGDLSANLRSLESLVSGEPFLPKLHTAAMNLFSQITKLVGWNSKPDEGHLAALLRSTALGQGGYYGDKDILIEAKSRFQNFLKDPNSLPPDLRGVVFGLVAQDSDQDTYNTLWDLYHSVELHEEKMRILGALTRSRNPEFLKDTLVRSLGSEVRAQDTPLVVVSTAGNPFGRNLAWEFLKKNWMEFDRRYGRGGFAIMRLVSITGGFTEIGKVKEVEDFFKKNPAQSAQRTIQQSLERIRLNAAWLENNRVNLSSWFLSRN
jgi:puromycin-sensitive aminopeptidase